MRFPVSLRIQSKCGKTQTIIIPNTDTFYAVINNTFRDRRKAGVPQGSILDPLLLSTFLNDILFSKESSLNNYADDSTLYAYNKNLETVVCNLRPEFSIISNWLYDNYMVLNPAKCHFMWFGVKENEQFYLMCNDITLKHSSHEKFLNVTINSYISNFFVVAVLLPINNKLSFYEQIINIYKTANKKLNALNRINHYMIQN